MKFKESDFTKKLGDEDYYITLDLNSICDFEELSGTTYTEQLFNGNLVSNMKLLRYLWLACLQQNHPEMTLNEAGKIGSRHSEVIIELLYGDQEVINSMIEEEAKEIKPTSNATGGVRKKSNTRKE